MNLPFLSKHPRVALLRLSGLIAARSGGFAPSGISAQSMAPLIERAFALKRLAGVVLVINSPGGSPVQSSLVAQRIRRLAQEKKVPVIACVEDAAASGGYWLACAADDIWVDPGSIVGSIGVIFASFGFPELMARQGVERRVVTAGRSKSFADPFLPQKPEDVERLRALQAPIHAAFINHVRARRGARLNAEADLFNADVWVGAQAVELGLADGVAHLVPKMKELYGEKVRLVPLGQRRGLAQRLGLASVAATAAGAVLDEVEERALWARYGL
jgi:serine protease SohB